MIAGEVRSPENDEPALSFTKLDAEKSIGGRGRYRELDETDLDVAGFTEKTAPRAAKKLERDIGLR